jgi:hypothetical protein
MPSDISREMLFDKRIVERNLRKGLIHPKDVEGQNKALVDAAERASALEATLEHRMGSGTAGLSAARRAEEEEDLD